jgi:hypothetical protein
MSAEEEYKGGPRTDAGKLAASKNSLKHGMCSSQIVLPGEDVEAFESLVDNLELDHKSANATEVILVHNLAKFQWLMNRAIRLQERAFLNLEKIDTAYLALMIRYQNTNHRAFTNTLKALHTAQKERVRQEKEFDSQQQVNVVFSRADDDDPDRDPQELEAVGPLPISITNDESQEQPRIFLRPPGKLA